MEHIGETVSKSLARSSLSNEQLQNGQSNGASIQKASDGARRAARVWRAMTELYGPSFKAAYGENPSPIWERAIAEMTDDQCRDGLTSLARQPREYPANLTQFVGACCPPSSGVRFLGTPVTAEQLDRMLPPPEKRATTETIDFWIKNMRRTVMAAIARQAEEQRARTNAARGNREIPEVRAFPDES